MIDLSFPEEVNFIGEVLNGLSNATLIFDVVKDNIPVELEYLPDGNAYVPDTEIQTINIQCYLKETPIANAILETNPGVDSQTTYFEGRLIDPKIYPLPIQAQGDIMVNINGQMGRVVSHRAMSSPLAKAQGHEAILGQKLAMYVQFQQGIASTQI
jgi:hypothetical protein